MRVLLTWELGAGLGHMMNLRPLAAELVARGHEVYLAAGDLTRAVDVFGDLLEPRGTVPFSSPGIGKSGQSAGGDLTRAVDVFGELLEDTPSRQGGQSHFAPKAPQNRDSPRRRDIKLLPAPWKTRRNKTTEAIYTFADLLLNIGFGDGNALLAHLAAWRSLFELVRPDVLVCDHSPTALLAAKTLMQNRLGEGDSPIVPRGIGKIGTVPGDFAVATVGTGFFTPPDESPLRLLRPVPEDQLPAARAREAKLLEIMNSAIAQCSHHAPHDETSVAIPTTTASAHTPPADDFITRRVMTTLDRVTQLYHDGRTRHFLLTFPELDHFPDRAGGDYRGALPYGLGGEPFERPQHVGESLRSKIRRGEDSHGSLGETPLRGACIFAYLKPFPALEEFLRLLSVSPISAVAYIDGIPASRLAKFQTDRLRFAAGPVDIRQAAEGCDAAITNGNSATCTAMLLAGKPLVSVPLFLEQGLFAAAVQRLGAGLTANTSDAKAILATLEQVLSDARYPTAARAFSDRHKDDNLADIPRKIVDDLEQLAAENASR